jgi:hypothetical protein
MKTFDLMRVNLESVWNEIEENDWQDEQRIEDEDDDDDKLWLIWQKSNKKMYTIRCMSIPNLFQQESVKVLCILNCMMNKGFKYDDYLWLIWEKNNKNAFDWMHVNSEFASKEIEESELQNEKPDEQRNRKWWWWIVIDLREEQE